VDYLVRGPNSCGTCGRSFEDNNDAWFKGSTIAFDLYRLKRIPPLDELDDVKQDEEIHA
jgi:hypothetical protein